jgi:hypothetical protein
MGYFDGLVDAVFKTDLNGQSVFYPWGVLGRGRVLKDPVAAQAAKLFLRRWYQVMLGSAVVLSLVFTSRSLSFPIKFGAAVAYAVVFIGWFFLRTRALVAGTEFSDERLTIRESHANTAARFSRGMLWGFLLIALLMTVGGVWMVTSRASKLDLLAGWTLIVMGPFCAVVFTRMLWLKSKLPPDSP